MSLLNIKEWRRGQWEAVTAMLGKEFHALFADIGSGKTIMLLAEAIIAWQCGLIDGALIVSWNGVHRDWVTDQLNKVTSIPCDVSFTPDYPIPPEAWTGGPVFYAMHREATTVQRYRKAARKFLKSGRMVLIWDESQDIRTPNAIRTKVARNYAEHAAYRRIASGFPNPTGMHNLYSQYTVLSPSILDMTTFSKFKEKYMIFEAGFKGHPMLAGYKNEDDFLRRVAPHTTHVEQDRRGRAPAVSIVRYVDLTPEQERHWHELKEEFSTILDSGEQVDVPLAVTRLMRLQQLTCGWLPREDGSMEAIKENRTRVLMETLAECTGKVVIWSRFRHDIPRLAEKIGKSAVWIDGSVPAIKREILLKRFQQDASITRLVAQPETIGTGRNEMVVADKDIFWSNDFKAITRKQAEGRIDRDGQRNVCTHIDIVCRNTYDQRILNTLRDRRDVSDALLRDISGWRDADLIS